VSDDPQFILDGGQSPVDVFQEQVCAVQFPLHGKDYKWKDEPEYHEKKTENEQHYHHAAENVAEKFHNCLFYSVTGLRATALQRAKAGIKIVFPVPDPDPGFSSRCITFTGRKVNATIPILERTKFPLKPHHRGKEPPMHSGKNSLAFLNAHVSMPKI
jgi:hypothetical protein